MPVDLDTACKLLSVVSGLTKVKTGEIKVNILLWTSSLSLIDVLYISRVPAVSFHRVFLFVELLLIHSSMVIAS